MEEEKQALETQPAAVNPTEVTAPVTPPTTGAEAALGQRIGAALIDSLVAMALAVVAGMIFSRLSTIAWIGYMLTRDSLPFLNGQSVGKKALGLQAVSESGKSLSGDWNPGLIRNITMAVPVMPLVELIIMIVNKDKPGGLRRLGDQWAKTKVVTVKA